MIKQVGTGWVITGMAGPKGAVWISSAEMSEFIHEQAQKLADRALAILIEHQRHALLPEQDQGHDK